MVTDALSCLDIALTLSHEEQMHDMHYLLEHFSLNKDDFDNVSFPVHYKLLAKEQLKDKGLLKKVQSSNAYQLKTFHGGRKMQHLICHNDKIIIPQMLQQHLTEWYHAILCHPVETHTQNK
jgi:Fe2+ or Zn2+ uptake regulation protein